MLRSKRIPVIVALFALGTVLSVLSICQPHILAENKTLNDFVTHEILVFLIVPVTITFASVAQIHLQITNMVRAFRGAERQRRLEEQFAKPLRDEINSSAWLLFWAFVACCLVVLTKGEFEHNVYVLSFSHGAAIVIVAINAVVLYDIHQTVFALAPALTGNPPEQPKTEPEPKSEEERRS